MRYRTASTSDLDHWHCGRCARQPLWVSANQAKEPTRISAGYRAHNNRTAYYRLLLETTRTGAWQPWPLFMLQAVEETAGWTTAKIAAIRALAEHTTAHVRKRLPKIYSRSWWT